MCLITTQKKPLKATKDIVCYKILKLRPAGLINKSKVVFIQDSNEILFLEGVTKYTLHAPYQDTRYVPGKVYRSAFRDREIFSMLDKKRINKGFHAYTDTLRTVKRRKPGQIFECVIPKGTRYFLGSNNGESAGICAESIIVVKPV